uniref:DUF4112 domain-containing protein n=1 Tax=mine drainage metagenome TaxID=410659 RepID=E6QM76_9ZZZZ
MTGENQAGFLDNPEKKPPSNARWVFGARLLDDRFLRALAWLLDESLRLPGTRIRLGLDGVIGLVPALGDALGGLLSLLIPFAGWVRGIAGVTLLRMMANLALGVFVGSVPILGDAFDIAWKANRRNYRLLVRANAQPGRHNLYDLLFLLLLIGIALAVLLTPIAFSLWLLHLAVEAWHSHG